MLTLLKPWTELIGSRGKNDKKDHVEKLKVLSYSFVIFCALAIDNDFCVQCFDIVFVTDARVCPKMA